MTAPAINPATAALPGLTGVGKGQAMGPLAGFDALLAALFGETDIAGVPAGEAAVTPTPTATQPTMGAMFVSFEDATGLPEAKTGDDPAAGDPAPQDPTAPDALVAAAAAPAPPAPQVAETTSKAATDAGQDAAAAAPAFAPPAAAAQPEAELADAPPAPATAPPEVPAAAPQARQAQVADAPVPAAQSPEPAKPETAAAAQRSAPVAGAAMTGVPAEVSATAPEPEPIVMPAAAEAAGPPTPQEEITRAADAPPAMPPSKKEKDKKGSTTERAREPDEAKAEAPSARPGAASTATAAPAGKAAVMAQAPKVEAPDPEPHKADLPEAFEQLQAAEAKASSHGTHASAPQTHAVRGSPETVASLAAQIVKKLEGRSTRFDVELDPAGLGKVDVRVEIGAHGRVTAALSFDNPQAAAELKSRSGELQKALEQAGFDLSGGGLSFDVAGDRGQARQDWGDGQQGGFRGRAFQQAMEAANDADLAAVSGELRLRRGVTAGVDVRI